MITITYKLKDGCDQKDYKVLVERVEEAQLIWDSMVYLRNAYYVTTPRPVERTNLYNALANHQGSGRLVEQFIEDNKGAATDGITDLLKTDARELTVPTNDVDRWIIKFEAYTADRS